MKVICDLRSEFGISCHHSMLTDLQCSLNNCRNCFAFYVIIFTKVVFSGILLCN